MNVIYIDEYKARKAKQSTAVIKVPVGKTYHNFKFEINSKHLAEKMIAAGLLADFFYSATRKKR